LFQNSCFFLVAARGPWLPGIPGGHIPIAQLELLNLHLFPFISIYSIHVCLGGVVSILSMLLCVAVVFCFLNRGVMSACEDTEQPFAFAKRANNGQHVHNLQCRHPLVQQNDTLDSLEACALAQLVHALPENVDRFEGHQGSLKPLMQAKTTLWQTLTPANVASGIVQGLKQAFMRLFGLSTVNSIILGIRTRSDKSNAAMNEGLLAGDDVHRAVRGDKYNRTVIYNYFHNDGEGELPDYCEKVEPNKNQRKKWKGKRWSLDGEELILKCQPKLRRGTLGQLAQDYLHSETHQK
jgi:hypothetical protein